jgi:hypothetical protein
MRLRRKHTGQRADLVFTMPANGSVRLVDIDLAGEQSLFMKPLTNSCAVMVELA